MKSLTITVATYNQAKHQLPLFLHSCVMQNSNDFKVLVMHDGSAGDPDPVTSMSALLTEKACLNFQDDLDLIYFESETRFKDFGHSLRAMSLDMVDTEYINWQNGDNYLTPQFVSGFMNKMKTENLDFCYSDILHNYANPGRPYTVLNSQPRLDHIDIANFITRTSWAKKTGLNHRGTGADGLFVQELLSWHGNKIRAAKLDMVTMVHN